MKIQIIGNAMGQSGYDVHTRSLANALNNQEGIEVALTCQLPQDWLKRVNDAELKMIQSSKEDCDVNLLIGTPPSWEYYLCEDKKFVGVCVWEGDKVPKSWLDIMEDERVSQVWVPSVHVKEAILNTLGEPFRENVKLVFYPHVEGKIRVVPHGCDREIFKSIEQIKKDDDIFTFITCGGWPNSWRDRKGISYLLKSFIEEFSDDEFVEMNVKINQCYGINLDQNLKDLDIQKQDGPKVNFVLDNLTQKQLNEFYNSGDVFITTSLAEAFNLPPLESMSCGVPVLSTDFGGQTDFVNEENGWLLTEGKMKEVKFDIQYEGISWKRPSIEEVRKQMRDIYNDWKDNNSKVIKEKSNKALEDSKEFTWENSAIKAKECLLELTE